MSTSSAGHVGWHVDDGTLERYVTGTASAPVAASTEAHLTGCSSCRARLAPAVPAARLDGIWAEVDADVDRLSLPPVERLLVRLGLGDDTARLLAATPSLSTSWIGAVTCALLFAALAADVTSRGLFVFLTIAPMLPVAGVAVAYGRLADPAHEIAVSAPYSLLRLVLLRSVVVVGTTVGLTAAAGLLLADRGWEAAAWLLPAVGLSLATLALSARVQPVTAAATVLGGWVVAVFVAWQATDDRLAAFSTAGQLAAAAVIGVAAAALLAQRQSFAFDPRRSV